jgi:hypothetical protein
LEGDDEVGEGLFSSYLFPEDCESELLKRGFVKFEAETGAASVGNLRAIA